MSRLRSFARFWWDFVVGDDWRVAAGIALALGLTWLASRVSDDAWWVLPLGVTLVLAGSLWRAAHLDHRPTADDSAD